MPAWMDKPLLILLLPLLALARWAMGPPGTIDMGRLAKLIECIVERHKGVRRLALVWAMALITWAGVAP